MEDARGRDRSARLSVSSVQTELGLRNCCGTLRTPVSLSLLMSVV